ncbi:hypothetical protein F0225_18725 [Vibrio pectenicida]|uniref:Uncharacterized protein n=1 Tax=Vibrio pectenicida TaxID=62763 RepID=A0A7Y4A266_9VIBR|nr:hypothetical protein [Vibrio pectenicida]NOH73352.1 hypothetical protein [Vibrio pectenicida]
MKLKAIIFSTLFLTSTAFATTSQRVYCGLPDGTDWDWLLDGNNQYQYIEGQPARVAATNNLYFNVFRVSETIFNARAFNCPAGYVTQPAESGTSRWEIFEIVRPDGSSYLIDSYKTIYSSANNQVAINHYFRSL